MNTAVQTVEPLRPRDLAPAQLALIRRTVAADCNEDEFDLYIEVAKRVGLDPFRRQIYAVVYNKDKPNKRKMSIITGIDGFRAVAARCGDYRPDNAEAMIVIDPDLKDPDTNPLGIERAVYTAYKRGDDGEWYPVVGTAYWEEFAPITDEWAENEEGKWRPTGKSSIAKTSNWRKMGRVMIVKCAESQALRKGWPEDLSGVYSEEEMARTINDETATETVAALEEEDRLKRVGGKGAIPIIFNETGIEMVPAGKLVDRVIEHIERAETADALTEFTRQNSAGLQQFWAIEPNDALELKKRIEQRAEKLSRAAQDDEPIDEEAMAQ